MKESDRIHAILSDLSQEKKINLFESVILFADENNLDVEDIIAALDTHVIDRIKADALNMNIVCNKKLFERPKLHTLF